MPPAQIRNLTERRVPQYLAVYLGAAFGLVEFVDFIATRYMLSPRWTDLTLLALVLLLPSVILYTYHHGRPGRDEWQRSEKIFIPINMLVLLGTLTFVGATSNLQAVTTLVTVTDETGNKIEAVVPNKAYRKRVAMFLFDSQGDSSIHWLRFGLPWFVYQDLQQQQFVDLIPPTYMRERLQRAGRAGGVEVPLTLKRDIASEMHIPHFVTGTLKQENGELVATVQVYETQTAKLVKERTFRSRNPADLSDQVSAQLLSDLEIPVITDAKPDLPVSELLTSNPQALRAYTDGVFAMQMAGNWPGGMRLVDRAIQLDSTFAAAHLARYGASLFTGQPDQALTSVQAAMDHGYRMPERMQKLVKADYYMVRGDFPRAFAVLDMLAQLYPDDILIHDLLVRINRARDDRSALIASLEKVLTLDPSRVEITQQLGDEYQRNGNVARALEYYEKYAKQFPGEARSFREIGMLHRRAGDHVKSRQAFEKALLVDPDDVQTLVEFATLERNLGEYEAAQDKFDRALAASKTPEDKAAALETLASFYEFTGQIAKAGSAFESALTEMSKSSPPAMVLMKKLRLPGIHAQVSSLKAEQELARLTQQFRAPFDMYLPVAELDVYDELDNLERMIPAVEALEQIIEKQQQNFLKRTTLHGRGRIHELRGNCAEAIRAYQEQAKHDPLAATVDLNIGRCYRKLGRKAEAEKALQKALRVQPASGRVNLELALLYNATGDRARSVQHAQRAAATWKMADADYKPMRELKALPVF